MPPLIDPGLPVRETDSVSFADLVRLLGESVAAAQMSLDRASATLMAELAQTYVDLVRSVTETIQPDGEIAYDTGEPQRVSLLELGITPSFYRFSEASVEVVMDVKIVETTTESAEGPARWGLFADTRSVKSERKLNRDVTMTSRLRATLVAVPSPLRVEPVRTTSPAAPT